MHVPRTGPPAGQHALEVARNAVLADPIPATAKAWERAGLSIADIGAFEIDQAFAPILLAWVKETGAEEKLTNPHGGAIALVTRCAHRQRG